VLGVPRDGATVNADQWDGYTADRRRLFEAITAAEVSDVLFLTGDIHSSWAADLPLNATDPAGPSAGAEFVGPSVTSPSIGDLLGAPPRTAAVPVENAIAAANPHPRYVALESDGYGVLDGRAVRAHADWVHVTDVRDAASLVRHGASVAVPSGVRIDRRTDAVTWAAACRRPSPADPTGHQARDGRFRRSTPPRRNRSLGPAL